MCYHRTKIIKGTLGEYSKIREEFDELTDAVEQEANVLIICELCDLVGAVEAYASKFNLTIQDLVKMKDMTKQAFEEGKR